MFSCGQGVFGWDINQDTGDIGILFEDGSNDVDFYKYREAIGSWSLFDIASGGCDGLDVTYSHYWDRFYLFRDTGGGAISGIVCYSNSTFSSSFTVDEGSNDIYSLDAFSYGNYVYVGYGRKQEAGDGWEINMSVISDKSVVNTHTVMSDSDMGGTYSYTFPSFSVTSDGDINCVFYGLSLIHI